MPVPFSGRDGVQRIVGLAEALHFFHVRRLGQCAIELVGPGVILALNASRELAFFLLAEHGAAMATDVVESSDVAVVIARDDHAGICKLTQKIISRIGNLAGSSGAEPHVKMDCLHLALEPCWIS